MQYEDGSIGIHECFYDEDDEMMWTQNAVTVIGNDIKDAKLGYDQMKLAFEKPILDYATGKEI